MNKLFAKVTAAFVGMAMAIGVGVFAGRGEIKQAKALSTTISYGDITGMTSSAGSQTGTASGFTFNVSNGLLNGHIRVYKSATFTLTAPSSYTLTEVTFTCTANGTAQYGPGCFVLNDGIDGDYVAGTGATGTWSGDASSITLTASSNQVRIISFDITYAAQSVCAISLDKTSLLLLEDGEDETVTVTANNVFSATPTISLGATPSYVDVSISGLALTITPKAIGSENITINAINGLQSASATLAIRVVSSHGRISSDPFTVAEAKAAIDGGIPATDYVYVTGIISEITPNNDFSGQIVYFISDDGTTTDQFEIYWGKNIGNVNFSAITDIELGATVVNYGKIKKFNSTYEFDTGSYLFSYTAPASYSVTYDANGGTGTITDSTAYAPGATVTVETNTFTAPDAFHTFNSFNTEPDGSGLSNDEGDTFTINAHVTLYAIWNVTTVNLANGSYTAELAFANPIPKQAYIKSNDTNVGVLSVSSTGITYANNEFNIAANGSGNITFTNHSNATITKAVFDIYNYDNFTVTVDGSTDVHVGTNYNGGNHYMVEVNMSAENTISVVSNNSYSSKIYAITLYLRVGSEVIHATGVTLNASSGNVYIDMSRQLTATVSPVDADDQTVSWTSSDPTVATVDSTGLVEGKAAGTATITVTTTDGGFTATFVATVKAVSYGTLESPLSVEEATEVLEATGTSVSAQQLTVRGFVTSTSWSSDNHNFTIWLRNTADTISNYFELYKAVVDENIDEEILHMNNTLNDCEVVCVGYGKMFGSTHELSYENSTAPVIKSFKYNADRFAYRLLRETNEYCSNYEDGVSDYAAFKSYFETLWTNLAKHYNNMDAAEKELLADADANESGITLEQGVARYDFLTGKYKLTNFITGRTISGTNVSMEIVNNNNNIATILIVIVSVISLSALGAFFFMKKRKEQ